MVVDMETEDGLKRRAVMVVAKKNWLAHAKLLYYKEKNILLLFYVLLLNRELGLSISSGFFRAKKLSFTPLVFLFNFFT